ncbi:MAG: calcium/sodium antiporter [Paramuribaculum sp.]|nr:calcium/sodium antiporter [Paramuribaculum sp.]
MWLSILLLILGLALILGGANLLTDGAAAIARRTGVSELVVGLTVVAFGTSAPELVISVMSALDNAPELAVGNVVGSNIFNILAIIGITALVRPISVQRGIMTREMPLMVLSSLVLLIMVNTPILDGTDVAEITRSNGLILLLFFAIFMRYTISQAKNTDDNTESAETSQTRPMPVWKSVVWVLLGLGGLIYGGDCFVSGASEIALVMGVSEAVIGLTIVAFGTSAPELATSIVAALKGKSGLAVGNVIGSNIFNAFAVLGISSTVSPLQPGQIGNFDMLTLVGASLMFWLFGWLFGTRVITRVEGGVMTAAYIAYVTCLVMAA